MRRTMLNVSASILLAAASCQSVAAPTAQHRICGKYSSVTLLPDETAQVTGAGNNSLSVLITGKSGSWLFYDSIVPIENGNSDDIPVLRSDKVIALRRAHDARIYVVRALPEVKIEGKVVQVGVMGIDLMRNVLSNPAIIGASADVAILKRIIPGTMEKCNLRWKQGYGLVK